MRGQLSASTPAVPLRITKTHLTSTSPEHLCIQILVLLKHRSRSLIPEYEDDGGRSKVMVKRCISENGTRTVLLIICSISYLLVGAAVFSALEFEEDQRRRDGIKRLLRQFEAKYNITEADFSKWAVLQRSQRGMDSTVEQWSFAGSVYFATTVITTIGMCG